MILALVVLSLLALLAIAVFGAWFYQDIKEWDEDD